MKIDLVVVFIPSCLRVAEKNHSWPKATTGSVRDDKSSALPFYKPFAGKWITFRPGSDSFGLPFAA